MTVTNSTEASNLSPAASSTSALGNGAVHNARVIFLTYVQPWLNLVALIENALIVIVFGFFVTPPRRVISNRSGGLGKGGKELATVSRLYYTLIAICEFFTCLFGFVLRDTLYYMPIWVSFLLGFN